jgi:NAD(P)-dependent dehydrogenase (short-subunit alcohol dehydrogenase family)
MSSKPVALIFGVGANIGTALVNKFLRAGYRVAAVSRSAADPAAPSSDGTTLPIRADLSQASQVAPVFETVRKTWGVPPRIVIWNAARLATSSGEGMFSIPVNEFDADLAVNTTSPWVAAGEAVKGWKTGDKGVFIYTGNLMAKTLVPYPGFSSLGSSKRATSYWVTEADKVFETEGWR